MTNLPYRLDVLYSKGANMPDTELFDLISENKSMSKTLAEYEGQKSTSISTAKRLAEFLGDQMVKDAGLSCRFIISKKPEGAPVTERAIPLAIFEAEPSIRRHYLRKWLKDNTMHDFDIRRVLDWDYYIERLGGTIQKIITIPAALQGIPNPVPRIQHPEWLHKKIMEKNDTLKQRKISELFTSAPKKQVLADMEDMVKRTPLKPKNVIINKRPREEELEQDLSKSWRQVLGNPPPRTKVKEWILFQKKKWQWQKKQKMGCNMSKRARTENQLSAETGVVVRTGARSSTTLGGFLKRTQRTLLDTPWQIIQVLETGTPGLFRLWALVGADLHCIKLVVPRIFYVNQKTAKDNEDQSEDRLWRKVQKTLPRAHPVYNLYEYRVPEEVYNAHATDLVADLSTPDVEGIYETQVPLEFRALVDLGCLCVVDKAKARQLVNDIDTFDLSWLQYKTLSHYPYLKDSQGLKSLYLYHHKVGNKAMYGLFNPAVKKGLVFVLDTVRSNQMPNLATMYNNERQSIELNEGSKLPEEGYTFEVKVENEAKQVYKQLQKALVAYKDERRGPTFISVQSPMDFPTWCNVVPGMNDFPLVPIHITESDTLYNVLDWQRVGSKVMIRHYLKSDMYYQVITSYLAPRLLRYGSFEIRTLDIQT